MRTGIGLGLDEGQLRAKGGNGSGKGGTSRLKTGGQEENRWRRYRLGRRHQPLGAWGFVEDVEE